MTRLQHVRRWAALGLSCTVLLGGAGWAISAIGDLPAAGAQTAPADPNARAVFVAIELTKLNAQLAVIDRNAADVTAKLAVATASVRAAEAQLATVKAQLDEALGRLRGRAAQSYQLGGAPLDPVLNIDHLESLSTVTKYANAAAAVDNTEVDRLTGQVADLTAKRDAAAAEQQSLSTRSAQLAGEHASLSDQVRALEYELGQLGGVPISGTSSLTAEQLAAWFQSTGAHANLPDGTSIADLARMYVEEGAAERVRGDLAFAQSVLETGSFSQTRGNNYAGIGNCDSCGGKGIFFPTPQDGVRAQIQLLRSYADGDSRAANLAHPPDPTLYGTDPTSAASKYDTFFLKGKVPLWNQMGNGNWATSTTYAAKVLGVYARMLAFAQASAAEVGG